MLGGAFNPPHTGHLLLAQEARWALELSEMVLMTTGEAPHKEIEDDPGAEVRLEMTRLAAATSDGVEASEIEVERDGPSYTYETLELLAEQNPGREIWFVLGADMAAGLGSWKDPERVVELARLAVVPRPGVGNGRGHLVAGAPRRRGAGGDPRYASMRGVIDLDQGACGGGAAASVPGAGPGGRIDRRAGAVPVTRSDRNESEAVARRVAEIADGKGATDVVALDVRGLVGYTDFLVICTARNERQAKAVS